MGINNLHEASNEDAIPAEDTNQFFKALVGDHVPRNVAGVPTHLAGSLGRENLQWQNVYAQSLFLNGKQVIVRDDESFISEIRLGVISGKSPVGRAGMCGWMLPAGAAGVQLVADDSDPLTVKLDGVERQRTTNLVGGLPLPGNLNLGGNLRESALYREEVQLMGQGPFPLGVSTDPADGDVVTLKVGSEYIVCTRDGEDHCCFAARGVVNTSEQAFAIEVGNAIAPTDAFSIVRTGHVFVDPTTSDWTISIEKRIRGSVTAEFPDDGVAGEMIYREINSRWYRYSGATWVQTNRVYLGLAIIEGGAVTGVVGVRTETRLRELASAFVNFGQPHNTTLDNNDIYLTLTEAVREVEERSSPTLISQQLNAIRTHVRITPENTVAGSIYGVYASADPGNAEIYIERNTAPIVAFFGSQAALVHPHRHALFLGSFATDADGSLVGSRITYAESRRGLLVNEWASRTYPYFFGGMVFIMRSNRSSGDAVHLDTRLGTLTQRGSGEVYIDRADWEIDIQPTQLYSGCPKAAEVTGFSEASGSSRFTATARFTVLENAIELLTNAIINKAHR